MNSEIAKERISYVVKPDSITASQGDFLATHVAIKRIHILDKFVLMPTKEKAYTEEQIFTNYVLNPNNLHQFIVVYGQSGTGKSHLIRWFEAKFQQAKLENEVILFIRRSDNTLKGTIRQLLEKPEVQGISNREVYERLVKASVSVDENKLKDMIYHNFIIEIHNDNDEHDIEINNVKRKRLEAFLNNEIVHDHLMSFDGPIERMYSRIAEHTLVDRDTVAKFEPKDFYVSTDFFDNIQRAGADPKAEKMAREFMADDTGKEDAEKIAAYLNQFVNDVIQRCAGIEPGDFKQIFQDIRKELYKLGKNLTLFIEDVTSFTGVDTALLDALMEEHTGVRNGENICRLSSVVGTTGNYLQHNFKDNHKDRVTKYVYIPSDVLDESGLFEFVGRYLNTMSLPEEIVESWVNNQAKAEDYPIHEAKEGSNWETHDCGFGKKISLYPFTKVSIKYLYQYGLTNGHKTPRYVIRDIIEPVVNDILYNPQDFPSVKYNMVNVNTTLSFMIHNQVKDEDQTDRVLRFISIWGNGKPEKYEDKGISYIAGINEKIYEELSLPILKFGEIKPGPTPGQGSITEPRPTPGPAPVQNPEQRPVSPEKIKRFNDANIILTKWSIGAAIDLSATGGTLGIIRAAKEDMCNFLFSAINWQAEGMSMDNVSKVKASAAKLVIFEKQTKGTGFYILPATWDSLNIVSAFIRWREYGNQSWDYPDSDFDAYLVTSWTSTVKDEVVKAVGEYKKNTPVNYIDAAVAAEMYRLILCGEFRERSLKNLTADCLYTNKPNKAMQNSHSKEWNSLVNLINQKGADQTNRDTIRQYFNITQGSGGTVVVLDALGLANTVRRVKTNKLTIPEDDQQADDKVKLRRDAYTYLQDILERIDSVSKAELFASKESLNLIIDKFDDDKIEEEDILKLVEVAKKFYENVEKTQINISVNSTDKVKKLATQIAKALHDISEVMDEADPLTILMTFSSDPVSILQPLVDLLVQLDKDIETVDLKMAKRLEAVQDIQPSKENQRYTLEIEQLDKCEQKLNGMR
ncbi:ATP-binding protein [Anaerocolumna xylanovorans]|uniref:AAA domain-containing protein n=1 Tax=Anaerocolumna xylanovorans DSM 12503 TaxID=1121345 RepID=A0A1M7YL91_9FIRM|nr:ATP-binding protein [Anaerocolumna xylanovorans]SHO53380.1 AAA domain-containing protein [Anaerocolumna xylanovorans DSM 12503]